MRTIEGPLASAVVEPLMLQVLLALVDARGAVLTRQDFTSLCWGGRIVGDDSLNRAIAEIRRVARATGADFKIETVPKIGYRLVDAAAPPPAARSHGPLHRAPMKRNRTTIAGLGIGAAMIAALLLLSSSLPVARDRIAVGEFRVMGSAPEMRAFGESLAAGISATMAGVGVETTGTRNWTPFGRAAEFALRGAVEGEEARLGIFVELADRRSGVAIWSGRMEGGAAESAALKKRMAVKVASVLSCALARRGARSDMPLETLRHYALFCDAAWGNETRFNIAAYSQRILDSDPQSPQAKALHAFHLARFAPPSEGPVALARQALKADPGNAEARVALAMSRPRPDFWLETEREILNALAAGWPFPAVIHSYAELLREVGRVEDALAVYQRCIAANPLDLYARTRFAWLLASSGDLPAARSQFARIVEDDPEWADGPSRQLFGEVFYGAPEVALAYLDGDLARRMRLSPGDKACYAAFIRGRAGQDPDLAELDRLCGSADTHLRARMFAALGDLDRAFAAAERFDAYVDGTIPFFYPEMKQFRRDPRFWPLAARAGLVAYWQQSGNWPDFCFEPDLGFDCAARSAGVGDTPS